MFVEICNTLNNLSNKARVPNKTEDLYLSVFNIVTRINESKTLIMHISCECVCKSDGQNAIQINGAITMNVDVSVKDTIYLKKIIFEIPVHVLAKMGNI